MRVQKELLVVKSPLVGSSREPVGGVWLVSTDWNGGPILYSGMNYKLPQ